MKTKLSLAIRAVSIAIILMAAPIAFSPEAGVTVSEANCVVDGNCCWDPPDWCVGETMCMYNYDEATFFQKLGFGCEDGPE